MILFPILGVIAAGAGLQWLADKAAPGSGDGDCDDMIPVGAIDPTGRMGMDANPIMVGNIGGQFDANPIQVGSVFGANAGFFDFEEGGVSGINPNDAEIEALPANKRFLKRMRNGGGAAAIRGMPTRFETLPPGYGG